VDDGPHGAAYGPLLQTLAAQLTCGLGLEIVDLPVGQEQLGLEVGGG
jgi:hypothetical protein